LIYLLYVVHVLLCIFLILVVLLQQGKGADLSVFGGGSTMTAFGARSATTLLHRMTVVGFVGFVLTTLLIAYLQVSVEGASVMRGAGAEAPVATPPPATAPAAPVEEPAPTDGGGEDAAEPVAEPEPPVR
jgi:preprotein translocase subunit SecG